MRRVFGLLAALIIAATAGCDGIETDTEEGDAVASCIDCHQSEEFLLATVEPEDTDEPEPEGSGEG